MRYFVKTVFKQILEIIIIHIFVCFMFLCYNASMIISPKKPTTKTIAIVTNDNKHIYIKFPETNDNFRNIVKSRLYFWEWIRMEWCKDTKKPLHRKAEIIRKLLEGGFIVESDDVSILRAQKKDYDPEPTRWVIAKDGLFKFRWYYNEDCYSEVRKLPASKYDKPYVTVPMEYYEEVVDFCEINNFFIYESAANLIEEAKQKLNNILFFCDTEIIAKKEDDQYTIDKSLLDV